MVENILSKSYSEINTPVKRNLPALVRVLSRISTLPKIDHINIRSTEKFPESFRIIPGKLLVIGEKYIANPVLALIYLRYGIEWQIWFQAFNGNKEYASVFDQAAFHALVLFYKLLPPEDKRALAKEDTILANLLRDFSHSNHLPSLLPETVKKDLAHFHRISISQKNFDEEEFTVFRTFAQPTEYLLMSGGDRRLQLSEKTLLNKYGCTPFPRPEAFTFASSTATSISNFAYDNTDRERRKLIESCVKKGMEHTVVEFTQKLKHHLLQALKVKESCEVIFSPSGTDSSLQIAAITQIATKSDILHILVGSDETGSGVPAALKGLHFEENTALNHPVKKGTAIDGFREVEVLFIPFRDKKGMLKDADEIDREVLDAVKMAQVQKKYVVLHVIDQSKLGYKAPSYEVVHKIKNIRGLNVQIVIDGSQLRFDSEDISHYLKNNYIITITGSKYFTGPPYSGALLIPEKLDRQMMQSKAELPIGLKSYFNRYDWPQGWPCTITLSEGANFGALMRWNAAIAEMKRYFNTPLLYRNLGIQLFCNFVDESIRQAPFLEPIYREENWTHKNDLRGLKETRSIFPFFIHDEDKVLDAEQAKKVYQLLNTNLSSYFEEASLETRKLAAQKCHIGQPVEAVHASGIKSAVVRISLGARVISDSWKDRDVSLYFRNVEEQMSQITVIIKKIGLILSKPELFISQ
ncbi:MAG: hypothetical protein CSA39_04340 [Flavobacteriales bacterium]|nr:MAG: hypothetical protein CSA39_04340 [Flavobacteriales bacterium]